MPKTPIVSCLLIALIAPATGCDSQSYPALVRRHDPQLLIPLETLRIELRNRAYEWHGPCSCEYRIPSLHAARALAYWGDPAVPVLIDALSDPGIDQASIHDALSEIGIPVHETGDTPRAVADWWEVNREQTRADRDKRRLKIGLPPADPEDWHDAEWR